MILSAPDGAMLEIDHEIVRVADYGNRIPSLTFEVTADDGPVAVSAIATEIAGDVSGDVALSIDGFAAAGGSVGAVLATLGQASGAWFAGEGAKLSMRDTPANVATIADAGFAVDAPGSVRRRSVAAIETVPRAISLGYYDPARDYQAGLQRVRRSGAGARDERIDVAAAIGAGQAKTLASAMMVRAESERTRRTIAAAFDGFAHAPGHCVRIAGEAGIWRIVSVTIEHMVTSITLVPIDTAPIPLHASSGRIVGAVDDPVGATILAAFEIPGLDDVPLSVPRISIAATGAGAGWRRAALLYSLDDGTSWIAGGGTGAPAVMGTVEQMPQPVPATLIDEAGAILVVVDRDDMMLGDADAMALDRGANLALLGEELIQFGKAEPMGQGRWRLTRLLRGRRGTEAAIDRQGDHPRFVLLDPDGIRTIDLPVAAIGRSVRVLASGVGDRAPVEARCVIAGRSVVPPSPAHIYASIGTDGGATVRWIRRSRAGWRWVDGVDAPLGEERESYRVEITHAGGRRIVETVAPVVTIEAADRASGSLTIVVRQQGVLGESEAASIVIPAMGETL